MPSFSFRHPILGIRPQRTFAFARVERPHSDSLIPLPKRCCVDANEVDLYRRLLGRLVVEHFVRVTFLGGPCCIPVHTHHVRVMMCLYAEQ